MELTPKQIAKKAKTLIPAEGEALLREKLNAFPNNMDLLSQLGSIVLKLGRPQEALDIAGEIIHQAPNDVYGLGIKTEALLALGRLEEALVVACEIQAREPDNNYAYGCQAQALLALNRPEEALAAANKKLQLDPFSSSFGYDVKIKALLTLNKLEEALEAAKAEDVAKIGLYWVACSLKAGELAQAEQRIAGLFQREDLTDSNRIGIAKGWKALVEAGVGNSQTYLAMLNLARELQKIKHTDYDSLLPEQAPSKPDHACLEQLTNIWLGNAARLSNPVAALSVTPHQAGRKRA